MCNKIIVTNNETMSIKQIEVLKIETLDKLKYQINLNIKLERI